MGKLKAATAIDPLITMLGDKDWFTRLTAAAALESIGDERGREAIKPLLKDPGYGRQDAGGANSGKVEEATDLSTGQRLS